MSEGELSEMEHHACPGAGSCGGMFTANTMSSISEAIGFAPLGSASPPAEDEDRYEIARESGAIAVEAVESGLRPSDFLSRNRSRTPSRCRSPSAARPTPSFTSSRWPRRPASTSTSRTSTRSALERRRSPTSSPAARGDERPPRGRRRAVVLQELLEADLLHGDALTVTGETMADALERVDPPQIEEVDAAFLHTVDAPIHERGAIRILTGNLAPEGAVIKITGEDHLHHEGLSASSRTRRTRWPTSKRAASSPATSSVFETRAPRRTRHARDARRHERRRRPGPRRRRRTVYRRPLLGSHSRILHRPRRPEAFVGGPIAALEDGDIVTIDIDELELSVDLTDEEIESRLEEYEPEPAYDTGVLAKYGTAFDSAANGAVTNPGATRE